MTNLKKYWDKGISLEEYIQTAQDRIEDSKTDQDFIQYYELGIQRMSRTLKTYKVNEEQLDSLKAKNFNGKILINSEPWCGDASSTVPALSKFLEAGNIDHKIFLRDDDQSLINMFLTDGTQSIPKVVIMDENFEVKNSWGPRPKHGLELLKKFKNDPENYPKEEFYNDLQVYYAKNKGKDAIDEILNLL